MASFAETKSGKEICFVLAALEHRTQSEMWYY